MKPKSPFEAFDPTTLFGDTLKAFQSFKLPGFDLTKLMEINRRDFEALSEANKIALAGLQAAPGVYQEQLRAAYTQIGDLAAQLMGAGTGAAGSAQAAQVAQQAIAKALGNVQELAESAQKSQMEAYALLLKRAHERVQELTALVQSR